MVPCIVKQRTIVEKLVKYKVWSLDNSNLLMLIS